jgi:hypothetical protein
MEEKKIYCKQCRTVVPVTANKLCVHCNTANWGYGAKGSFYDWYRRNRFFLGLALAIAMAVASIFIVQLLNDGRTKATRKAAGNIMLLQHDFVYDADMEMENGVHEKQSFVLLPNNQFDLYEPGITPPNRVSAVALVADNSGHCITSVYAAAPWGQALRQKQLEALLQDGSGNIFKTITLSGHTVFMGMVPNGTDPATFDNAVMECESISPADAGPCNIAFIGRKDKAAMPGYADMGLSNAAPVEVMENEQLYLFAFDNTAGAILHQAKLSAAAYTVKVTAVEAASFRFAPPAPASLLLEGSALFNKNGRLAGIVTCGGDGTQQAIKYGHSAPSALSQAEQAVQAVKVIENVPTPEQVTDVNKKIDDLLDKNVMIPFGKEKGWDAQKDVELLLIPIDNMDTIMETAPFMLTGKTRVRVKYESSSPGLRVYLMDADNEEGPGSHVYRVRAEGLSTFAAGNLTGSYRLRVKYNFADRFRVVVETKSGN